MEFNEYANKKHLIYNILKDNFMTEIPEKRITWIKNNKIYLMNCEELKMNGKIMGFIFHFEKEVDEWLHLRILLFEWNDLLLFLRNLE